MDAGSFVKIGLDLVFLVCVILSLNSTMFVYMKYINVGLIDITYSFSLSDFGLSVSENECPSYLPEDVCNKAESWIYAGVFYLIFAVLSMAIALMSLLSIASSFTRTEMVCIRLKIYHFLYVILYSIAYLGYVQISEVYSLDTYGLGPEYGAFSSAGLYLMFFCELAAVCSISAYLCGRRTCVCDLEEKFI